MPKKLSKAKTLKWLEQQRDDAGNNAQEEQARYEEFKEAIERFKKTGSLPYDVRWELNQDRKAGRL